MYLAISYIDDMFHFFKLEMAHGVPVNFIYHVSPRVSRVSHIADTEQMWDEERYPTNQCQDHGID